MSDTYRGQDDPAKRISLLTDREREVLRLAARLGTSKRIAAELGIEPASVDTTLYRATTKLGIKGRAAAATLLIRYEEAASRNLDNPPSNGPQSRPRPVVPPGEYPLPGERDPDGSTLLEVGTPFEAEPLSKSAAIRRLLFEAGERHDLTLIQQLRATAFWTLAGLIILCLLGIILAEVGRAWAYR